MVFYEPANLAGYFIVHQIEVEIRKTENFFLYGWGTLQK
jgi:hypothetical protein